MIKDLEKKIRDIDQEGEDDPDHFKELMELLIEDNYKFNEIKDRIALMLMNKTQGDYGITDQMIETDIDDHP